MQELKQYSGFLNIDKPPGITSFEVIRRLRKLTGIRKIGHSGVLDKPATGVLPVGIGSANRLFFFFGSFLKVYLTSFLFGLSTSTDDIYGKIIDIGDAKALTVDDIEKALRKFIGSISQIPPTFSTTKVGGKRFYQLAAKGKEVPAREKSVVLENFEILDFKDGPSLSDISRQFTHLLTDEANDINKQLSQHPKLKEHTLKLLTIRIFCRGGFYVRSLARDLGETTSAKGCVFSLVREQVGPFKIENSLTLEQIERLYSEGKFEQECLLPKSFIAEPERTLTLDMKSIHHLKTGRPLFLETKVLREELQGTVEPMFILDADGQLVATAKTKMVMEDRVILTPTRILN